MNLLRNRSVDAKTGIHFAKSIMFASERTAKNVELSFDRLFKKVDSETANNFAQKILDIANLPQQRVVVALNNHDQWDNECQKIKYRIFPTSVWNQMWDEGFEKGKAHSVPGDPYSIVCWDNIYKSSPKNTNDIDGEGELMHEFGHLHRFLFDRQGHFNDFNTPASSWLIPNKEEEVNFKVIDDRILAADGRPPRTEHFDLYGIIRQFYVGKKSNIIESGLNGEVPRELPYIFRGLPIPEVDAFPRTYGGTAIRIGQSMNMAGIMGVVAFMLAKTHAAKNTFKKLVSLPGELLSLAFPGNSQKSRNVVSNEGPASKSIAVEKSVKSQIQVQSDTHHFQVRQKKQKEWQAASDVYDFPSGGKVSEEKSKDPSVGFVIFTPNNNKSLEIRIPIASLPIPSTMKEKGILGYLKDNREFNYTRFKIEKGKIVSYRFSKTLEKKIALQDQSR